MEPFLLQVLLWAQKKAIQKSQVALWKLQEVIIFDPVYHPTRDPKWCIEVQL